MKVCGCFGLGQWIFLAAGVVLFTAGVRAADPVVSNVRASQRPGTRLVDIYYDLAVPDSSSLTVTIAVSTNGGASYTLPASKFTGALGAGVAPGSNKQITWNAGLDWNGHYSANVRAAQRPGTKWVDIYYDLADADIAMPHNGWTRL